MLNQNISIVIPVYNGADTIERLIDKLTETLKAGNLQIVLVNDGSLDNSHDVLCGLVQQYPSVITYLNLSRNFGEHNAVMAGLNHARGDYVVIMDDDFQNPPQEVLTLVNEAVAKKYDIVYSYYKKKQHNFFRNLGSRFHNYVASFMLKKPRDLYLSSFKCLSKFAVGQIVKYSGPFPYIDGLALRCTSNIGKAEVMHNKRETGVSGYTYRKLIGLWLNMFVNFSINPLRLSSLIGVCCCGAGLVLGILVINERIHHPELPIGWTSLVLIILFFVGVQLLMLGILGEYMGRLFLGNNQTPQFIIRDIYGKSKEK